MNRHHSYLFRLLGILFIALLPVKRLQAYADKDGIDIYGSIINYGEGSGGIYQFNTVKPGNFTPVKLSDNLIAEGGGVLAGSTYYAIRATKTLYAYDADTWELLYSKSVKNVTLDMAYDETTKNIYGCFVDNGAQLGILNPKDGTYEKIGAMSIPACMMVCDAEGVLYAVGHDGVLYNVNKNNGEMTEIGSTGITPMFAQSAAIDPESGLCYWVSLAPDASSCLVELNLKTAETGWIYDMPNGEEITGMFILPKADADAPAKATDMHMDADGRNVIFTAPTMTVDGNALAKEELTYSIDVYTHKDRTTVTEKFTAMPGETISYPVKKTEGQIKISVTFKNAHGNGEKAILFFWMGEDTAAAVENLNVEKESNNSVRICWEMPKKGEHGGVYDKSSIVYRITRFPGNVVVSDKCSECWITDKVDDTKLKKYYYEVIPYTGNDRKQGVKATSNDIVLGTPYELPYTETFSKMNNNFGIFTVVDGNKDGDTWYFDDYAEKVKYSGNSEETADDWLITPPVHIEAGNVCSLSFYTTVGFGGMYTEHMVEVMMGNKPGIKDLDVQVMPVTKISSTKGQKVKVKFETTKDDEYYFGIHMVSDGRSLEFSVDNIKIEKKASVEGPAAASDLMVTAGEKGSLRADISFTAPETSYNGNKLSSLSKIEVFRNKTVIKTYTDVKPGEKISLQDNPTKAGLYNYKVVAYSDKGSGDEAEVEKFIGVDVPGKVTNISVKEAEDGKITITWDAPTEGMNGGYIDENTLIYTVLRNGWKPIAEATSERTATDPMEDLREGVQGVMQYQIMVKTDAGKGEDAYSPFVTAGEPYTVPFVESFVSGLCKYEPWSTMPRDNGGVWRYDKFEDNEPYDGDKGMMAYTTQNTKPVHSMMLSPKVRISDTVNPQLSFWLSNSAINDDMEVEIWTENKPVETVKKIDLRKASGWTEYVVNLTPYKDCSSIQFAFHITNAVKNDRLHIDNMRITDVLNHNLAAENIKAPLSIEAGKEGSIELKVVNYGKETADNYTVDFLNGDKLIKQVNGSTVEADSFTVVSTTFVPQVTDIDIMKINAVINYDADENIKNNTSVTVSVKVLEPAYPKVNDLTAVADYEGNILSWSEPDLSGIKPNSITDDFETYKAFAMDYIGDWTLIDADQNQYSMEFKNSKNEWITYPNSGGAACFQVIDVTKIKATTEDGWYGVSGNKFLICPYAMGDNEDWLISPGLYSVEQEIVINAKSLNFNEYGLESFTVLYSTTGKDKADFKELGKAADIPTDWTEYRFTLPEDAKYFAVRATGTNSALFIDDITFIPATAKPLEINIKGYNVYRDKEKINNDVVCENNYTDCNGENMKEYTYNVTVMYDLGESGFSNEAVVTTITTINDARNGINIMSERNKIIISGAENRDITVTDINGMVITRMTGDVMTTITVNEGIYILKIGDNAYKINVK